MARPEVSVRQLKPSKPTRADARHEAAHAVVAVRLGLPLDSTTIRRSQGHALSDGYSLGYTSLVPGTVHRWERELPSVSAQDKLRALATQCAAGVVAEMTAGADETAPAHRDDLQQIVQIAGALGLGGSTDEAPVREFVGSAVRNAAAVLSADGEVAWDRVTVALFRKQTLSGGEVEEIVAAVETVNGSD